MLSFDVTQTCGKARLGVLRTVHGDVPTPVFMPVGTAGTVKGVTPDQLRSAGGTLILANTYHLMLRPGAETVSRLGGLHRLMAWDGPILTDSGGYQVFSLAERRSLDDRGVRFRSHIDGNEVFLSPRRAVEIQRLLGSDIMMQLDECPPAGASREHVAEAVRRSAAWAAECKEEWLAKDSSGQTLFGIQQGGVFLDLRERSAAALVAMDLPGYAIGGLSVGEGHDAMVNVLDAIDGQLPRSRPRYLMGVGEPRDMLAAVARGIDMFDCVLPTRNGRNAQAFTWSGRLRLRNASLAEDTRPLEEGCDCYACCNFSRGTIRHLFMAQEMLAATLVTIHNLRFFFRFMEAIRAAIAAGCLAEKAGEWTERMYPPGDEPLSGRKFFAAAACSEGLARETPSPRPGEHARTRHSHAGDHRAIPMFGFDDSEAIGHNASPSSAQTKGTQMKNVSRILLPAALALLLTAMPLQAQQGTQPSPSPRPLTPENSSLTTAAPNQPTAAPTTGESGQQQQQQQQGKPGGGIFDNYFLFIIIGVFLLMYILMGRSRRKQEAKRKEMLSSLKKGDKITTIGGVIGTAIEVREDEVVVKVDDNTRIKFARWAVRGVGEESKTEKPEDKK